MVGQPCRRASCGGQPCWMASCGWTIRLDGQLGLRHHVGCPIAVQQSRWMATIIEQPSWMASCGWVEQLHWMASYS